MRTHLIRQKNTTEVVLLDYRRVKYLSYLTSYFAVYYNHCGFKHLLVILIISKCIIIKFSLNNINRQTRE